METQIETAALKLIAPNKLFKQEGCSRCGGNGKFGPLSVENGRCFKCVGTGRVWKRGNEAKFASAYIQAVLRSRECSMDDVRVSDYVKDYNSSKSDPYKEVIASYVRFNGRSNTKAVLELSDGNVITSSSYSCGEIDTTDPKLYELYKRSEKWNWGGSVILRKATVETVIRLIVDEKVKAEILKRLKFASTL
jgi:hypothetical protein